MRVLDIYVVDNYEHVYEEAAPQHWVASPGERRSGASTQTASLTC